MIATFSSRDFRADEEPVDPKKYLEEGCKPKCVKPLLEYQVYCVVELKINNFFS